MKLYKSLLIFLAQFSFLNALEFTKSDILPSTDECGFQNCEAYPWLVFIPLESRIRNPGVDLRCAGVLISKRYVITKSSCLQFVLTKVHIGQFSTSNNKTCEDRPVMKIEVEDRVVNFESEIVLLRLAEDVEFGADVTPICLPFDGIERAETGSDVYTSGWGSTSYHGDKRAKKMKKVHNTVITNKDCQKSGVIEEADINTIMCVKQNGNQLDFPCDGDEGSPVMFNNDEQWVLEGILGGLYDGVGERCAIKKPASAARITEEVLQFIVDNVRA